MGCKINLKCSFESDRAEYVVVDFAGSQVRTKLGWWKKWPWKKGGSHYNDDVFRVNLPDGRSYQNSFEFSLKCNANRRYRLNMWQLVDGEFEYTTAYYPSSTGWCTGSTLNLGNLSRFF